MGAQQHVFVIMLVDENISNYWMLFAENICDDNEIEKMWNIRIYNVLPVNE